MTARNRRGRRWVAAGAALAAMVLLGAWGVPKVAARSLARSNRIATQGMTLSLIGGVALAYLRDTGTPPRSVDDLFAAHRLERDGTGMVWLYDAHGEVCGSLPDTYVAGVRLRLPGSAGGYKRCGSGVIEAASGERLVLIDMPTEAVLRTDLRRINDYLGTTWLDIVEGQPASAPSTGDAQKCSGATPRAAASETSPVEAAP